YPCVLSLPTVSAFASCWCYCAYFPARLRVLAAFPLFPSNGFDPQLRTRARIDFFGFHRPDPAVCKHGFTQTYRPAFVSPVSTNEPKHKTTSVAARSFLRPGCPYDVRRIAGVGPSQSARRGDAR